jgi:hypothetical protein
MRLHMLPRVSCSSARPQHGSHARLASPPWLLRGPSCFLLRVTWVQRPDNGARQPHDAQHSLRGVPPHQSHRAALRTCCSSRLAFSKSANLIRSLPMPCSDTTFQQSRLSSFLVPKSVLSSLATRVSAASWSPYFLHYPNTFSPQNSP